MVNKNLIFKKYNKITKNNASSYGDCRRKLQSEFEDMYKLTKDWSRAFKMLLDKYPFLSSFSYTIDNWHISITERESEEVVLNSFNNYYNRECISLEEMIEYLRVYMKKVMINCGCDPVNAYLLISKNVVLEGLKLEMCTPRLYEANPIFNI